MIQKLLNTTAVRLSLLYAVLFSLITAGCLIIIYHLAGDKLQQQTDARLQLETRLLLSYYRRGAVQALNESILLRNNDQGTRFFFSGLIPRWQMELYPSMKEKGVKISNDPLQLIMTRPLGEIVSLAPNLKRNDPARILVTFLDGGRYQLVVGTDLNPQHALLYQLLLVFLIANLLMLSIALIGGGFIGKQALRRLGLVSATAQEIIKGKLHKRMPVTSRNDEFDKINMALNTMLERIEMLMQDMRQVTDNLAHDLRTPLNRIRNRLESSQLPSHPQDYPQIIQDTLQDVDGVIQTFNALLNIAQMEAGVQREAWQTVDLTALVEDLGELYAVVAEEQGLTFSYQAQPFLSLQGNRQLLAQALTNLLDNAIKYTPTGGHITLTTWQESNKICVSIADNGVGIPTEQHEHVFKRFTRLDNARSSIGNGLGLSLVKAVVDLHQAQIHLSDNQPGLKATITFIR